MTDTSLTMRLALDSARWSQQWRRAGRDTKRSTDGMRRHVGEVGRTIRGVRNAALAMGLGFGFKELIVGSAQLDKNLIGVKQTAGATAQQTKELRGELHKMRGETGQAIDSLKGGFDSLIQSGESWESAMATLPAINHAMAVTGAQAEVLAAGLSVAGEAFEFDLSKPGLAIDLLDKMVMAGRLGNAELEDLSSIFGRIGINAKSANLGFGDTLGFVEQLSLIERQPERLATLADSTLRIFTNQKYKNAITKSTGIRFFNKEGDAREAIDVLDDIGAKYKKLTTDAERSSFMGTVFGKTDLDTQRGLRALLSGDALNNMRGMIGQINSATGVVGADLEAALDNAIDQGNRLKAVMGEAADRFSQPINEVITKGLRKLVDPKEKGGWDLSGGEMLGGGAAIAGALVLGQKFGSKAFSKLSGNALGTAQGVAVGKSLESAAGITPVYVVNMPGGGVGSGVGRMPGGVTTAAGGAVGGVAASRAISTWRLLKGQSMANLRFLGVRALATAGGLVGGAGLAGYGAGKYGVNPLLTDKFKDNLGGVLTQALANLGFDFAKENLDRHFSSKVEIMLSSDGSIRPKVQQLDSNADEIRISQGPAMGAY